MSNRTADGEQAVHHHYHFYGADGAPPSQAGGGMPPPGVAAWAAANRHQHPRADSLLKGLIVGAGAAYLLTNENVQRTVLRAAVRLWTFLQGGMEEVKERLHDAEAEVAAEAAPADIAPEPEPPPPPPPSPARRRRTKARPAEA